MSRENYHHPYLRPKKQRFTWACAFCTWLSVLGIGLNDFQIKTYGENSEEGMIFTLIAFILMLAAIIGPITWLIVVLLQGKRKREPKIITLQFITILGGILVPMILVTVMAAAGGI